MFLLTLIQHYLSYLDLVYKHLTNLDLSMILLTAIYARSTSPQSKHDLANLTSI